MKIVIYLYVLIFSWLGCKWTVALSFTAYMPFIMAQFFPRFYTMIPAGLSVGLGGGPLWCAKCTYLTVASEAYSQITGIKSDILVIRFFGLFFMFYQFAQVWGNLISSAGKIKCQCLNYQLSLLFQFIIKQYKKNVCR